MLISLMLGSRIVDGSTTLTFQKLQSMVLSVLVLKIGISRVTNKNVRVELQKVSVLQVDTAVCS